MKEKISLNNKTILITGACGFIGYHLSNRLLKDCEDINLIGLDNMMDNNDLSLKEFRLEKLKKFSNFILKKESISDKEKINEVFQEYKPHIVINLAGKSSIRDSIDNPDSYIEANVLGFYNVLEACRQHNVEHLIYASSSSIYDGNTKVPFSIGDKTDTPGSLYSASKKSNELFAYCYSKLYGLATTGLRFFTVYGPLGRPDMAYFKFTNMMIKGETIKIYNYGNCKRNFTYIDDIVEGIIRVVTSKPYKESNMIPYSIYNISSSKPDSLLDFVTTLEEELVKAEVLPSDYDFDSHKELVPMQAGDTAITYADVSDLERDFGYKPNTSLRKGLREFAKWYKNYYK